jgi:hypothetical protein
MPQESPKGYIWPVTEDLGLQVFNDNDGYFEYGYRKNRNFNVGDFVIFYRAYHLLGMVPVVNPSGPVGAGCPYQAKPSWQRDWNRAVGLDFSEKRIFSPSIHVQDLVDDLHFLNGKAGRQLHDICHNSPEVN